MNFTDDQQKAIDIKERQVLLSAAAGSGKTAVLIEHIFKLLMDTELDITLDNLLVLTFTDKASKEMRDRLQGRLNKALDSAEDDESINKITEQISLLNFANISTIHSFCRKLIKQNFHVVGLDPSFRLSDEENTKLLMQESILEVLEEKYEKKEKDFLNVVELFSDKVMDNSLIETILKIYSFSMSNPFPEKWLDNVIKNYDVINGDLKTNPFIQILNDEIIDTYTQIVKSHDKVIETLGSVDSLADIQAIAESSKDNCINILEAVKKDIKNGYKVINTYSNDPLTSKRGNAENKDILKYAKDLYKNNVQARRKKIEEQYFYKPLEDLLEDIEKQKDVLIEIKDIIIKFEENFANKKREQNVLDYDDLEHFAIKILVDEEGVPTKIAKQYQEQFFEIMIDEFQDTNLVQETIINAMLKEDSPYKNKYMVGDLKQSIYKFRKADPKIFINNYDDFSSGRDDSNVLINLSKNFRSKKGVISGTNYIFESLMKKDFGGIDYNDDVKLNQGRSQSHFDDDFVSFMLLSNESLETESDNEVDEEIQNLSKQQKEAKFVAKEIFEIVNRENPLQIEDSNGIRNVEYKDITILLRSLKNVEFYLEELSKYGITATALNQTDYFYQIEIKTMIAYLSIIDNRTLDISLVSVLTSEIYDISPDELLKIKTNSDLSFYENLINYNPEDKVLKNKINKFIAHFEEFKKSNNERSLTELLWLIFSKTNYLNIVKASSKGNGAYHNLMVLLEKAREFENSNKRGLFNFIKYIDKSIKSKVKVDSLNSDASINSVNIMTIHKSKGLEFPVVFLCKQGVKFNDRDEKATVLLDDELGMSFKYLDDELKVRYDTIFSSIIKLKLKKERLEEEARLLYVAMTRATDKLYISGFYNKEKSFIERLEMICSENTPNLIDSFKNAKSYLDLMMPILITHSDFNDFRDSLGIYYASKDSDVSFDVKLLNDSDIDSNLEESILNDCTELKNEAMFIDISKLYESKEVVKVPININISEIKKIKMDSNLEKIYAKPKFIADSNSKILSGAQRGTIIHKFLENLDFKKDYNIEQLQEISNNLMERDILDNEEVSIINYDNILAFLNSDICNRIKNSDNVFVEKAFAFYIDRNKIFDDNTSGVMLLHGVIDLYFYEGDEVVIVDYKTDYMSDENKASLISEYKLQLEIYRDAVEKAENKKVKNAYVYSFFKGELLEIL